MPRVLLLVLLAALGWLVARSFRRPAEPRSGARRPGERAGEPMVRDRVCNTFLPRARALAVEQGGRTHHFCSPACRDRFVRELGA